MIIFGPDGDRDSMTMVLGPNRQPFISAVANSLVCNTFVATTLSADIITFFLTWPPTRTASNIKPTIIGETIGKSPGLRKLNDKKITAITTKKAEKMP